MVKLCPRCRKKTMVPQGKIRAGPQRGLRRVYKCKNCGYQSMIA